MLREMSMAELGGWLALYRVSPWGEMRADLRAGTIASVIANVNRDPKKRSRAYRPVDFMHYHQADPGQERRELQGRLLKAFGVKLDPKKIRKKGR